MAVTHRQMLLTTFKHSPQCSHAGDGLKTLELLDLTSVFTEVDDRRHWNVDADVRYVDFTRMSISAHADAITRS